MEWFPMEPYSIIFYDMECALITLIFHLFVDYFLRELLNWLVLLVVNHTGYKNLFFFLLSYMVRSIFNLKKFLRKGDTNALAEF